MHLGKLREFMKMTANAPDYVEVFVGRVNPAEDKWSFEDVHAEWTFQEERP